MDWSNTLSLLATCLGIAGVIIGWVNSKSKNDKASAAELAELKKDMESKVAMVQFVEFSTKMDTILDSVKRLEQDMYSVVHISNTNSEEIIKLTEAVKNLSHRVGVLEDSRKGE